MFMKADKIIYSKRKSLAISITDKGDIVVRAPKYLDSKKIELFLIQHKNWIEKKIRAAKSNYERAKLLNISPAQKREYRREARKLFTKKLNHLSEKTGIKYKKLRLSSAKKRWGSCSSSGNINLNWRLVLTKDELIDYVILHEISHIKHLNHSKKFWNYLSSFDPDYKNKRKMLKEFEYLFLLE